MGVYLNPPKSIFSDDLHSDIYVDKSGIFEHLNRWLSRDKRFVCLTRPLRFGKSMAAAMIAAYYGNGHDSRDLFDKLAASRLESYEEHINKYAVISFDAQSLRDRSEAPVDFVPRLHRTIGEELAEVWPEQTTGMKNIADMLIRIHHTTGTRFVIIIDEWDSIFRRDRGNDQALKAWVQFLRSLFKSAEAKQYIALAYITGILPIKKYDVESSLNVFSEYTMLDSSPLELFFGFTHDEVSALCQRYEVSFEETKRWYDGYRLDPNISIYNPRAVVECMLRRRFSVYWTQTGAFDVLQDYINLDFEGLREDITQMLMGLKVPVDTNGFNTSLEIRTKDDVLTSLIHLGYLTYDFDTQMVWIPNQEIAGVMQSAIVRSGWTKTIQDIRRSKEFIDAVQNRDSVLAARIIEEIHDDISVPLHYNSEGDLTATLLFACKEARNFCILGRELPSSRGYADVVLIPTKPGCNFKPTVFELKLDSTTESAIEQIERNKYFSVKDLQNYHGEVLAVAMVYNKKLKSHLCDFRTFEI